MWAYLYWCSNRTSWEFGPTLHCKRGQHPKKIKGNLFLRFGGGRKNQLCKPQKENPTRHANHSLEPESGIAWHPSQLRRTIQFSVQKWHTKFVSSSFRTSARKGFGDLVEGLKIMWGALTLFSKRILPGNRRQVQASNVHIWFEHYWHECRKE